jgi:hypothetical protein
MSISDATELALIAYTFNATAPSWAAAGSFYFGLCTADPGESGTAATSPISYTGYARAAIVRTTSGFTAANPTANVAAINTGAMTAGAGGTATFGIICDSSSGAGNIIASGAITPNIVVSNGVTPSFAAGAITFSLD